MFGRLAVRRFERTGGAGQAFVLAEGDEGVRAGQRGLDALGLAAEELVVLGVQDQGRAADEVGGPGPDYLERLTDMLLAALNA